MPCSLFGHWPPEGVHPRTYLPLASNSTTGGADLQQRCVTGLPSFHSSASKVPGRCTIQTCPLRSSTATPATWPSTSWTPFSSGSACGQAGSTLKAGWAFAFRHASASATTSVLMGPSSGPGCYLLAGRLGAARSSVEPSLACPVAPPLGVCMDEPPAAEDLPPSVLLQPESARANEAMMMSASFMSHEKQAARPL